MTFENVRHLLRNVHLPNVDIQKELISIPIVTESQFLLVKCGRTYFKNLKILLPLIGEQPPSFTAKPVAFTKSTFCWRRVFRSSRARSTRSSQPARRGRTNTSSASAQKGRDSVTICVCVDGKELGVDEWRRRWLDVEEKDADDHELSGIGVELINILKIKETII